VHDITDLEAAGVPGVFVASAEFVAAAAAQDRSDDEMRVLADEAVDDVLARLLAS
jgi:hypothetical protein